MAEMCLTPAALYFGSLHAQAIIGSIDNTCFGDRLIEAGPSTSAVKLSVTLEQCISTSNTTVQADFFRLFKLACPGSFCSFLPGDIILLRRKQFFPIVIFQLNLSSICGGILRRFFAFIILHNGLFFIVGL